MVPSNFEGLVGYRTLRDEGQVPLKAYGCVSGYTSTCKSFVRLLFAFALAVTRFSCPLAERRSWRIQSLKILLFDELSILNEHTSLPVTF